MKKPRIYLLLPALLGFWVFLAGPSAYSADLKSGESVKVTSPVDGDLYTGAGEVEIMAAIRGDLIAAGGELLVADSVLQDLLIAGGNVRVTGWVGDDIRVGGGEVELDGLVLGDVVAAGGNVRIGPEAVIEGDLILAGGEVEIRGRIKGEIRVAGGRIEFSGTAEGPLSMTGGELQLGGVVRGPARLVGEKISLSEGARFEGEVRYWQEGGEIDFGPAMVTGNAIFDPGLEQEWMEEPDWGKAGLGAGLFWMLRLLAVLLILIVFTWLFGRHFRRAGETADQEFWRSMGIGALYLIGVPVLVILLMVIVIGIPLGLLAMSVYGLSLLFAGSLTSLVWAHFANLRLGFGLSKGMLVLFALVLFVLLKVIGLIPIVGWLVGLAALLVAFGALLEPVLSRR